MAEFRKIIDEELAEILQRQTHVSRQIAERWQEYIAELWHEYKELDGARKVLLKVIAGSEEDSSEPLSRSSGNSHETSRSGSRVPDPDRSEWWAWTLKYLQTAPTNGITVEAVWQGANDAGHGVKRSTVKSTLSHAYREGKVLRIKSGRYASVESEGPSPASDGPTSSLGEATN